MAVKSFCAAHRQQQENKNTKILRLRIFLISTPAPTFGSFFLIFFIFYIVVDFAIH